MIIVQSGQRMRGKFGFFHSRPHANSIEIQTLSKVCAITYQDLAPLLIIIQSNDENHIRILSLPPGSGFKFEF